jgi:hypothetical protein
MAEVRLELPPHGTFFNMVMTTSLSLLLAYINPEDKPSFYAQAMYFDVPSDDKVGKGIEEFVNDLKSGKYGIRPPLGLGDTWVYLGNLIDFFSQRVGRNIGRKIEDLLNAYVDYVKSLASNKMLVKELTEALGRFDNGYPEDSKICDIQMPNRLAPEYMEAIRMLGGVGFKSVPERIRFSRLRIGPHSACLGLAGLWATLVAVEENAEYYIFPDIYVAPPLSKRISDIKESLCNTITEIKGRPPTNIPMLALLTSLTTAGMDVSIRRYTMAVIGKGGRRTDLFESGLSLSPARYLMFADKLKEINKDAVRKLISLFTSSLEEFQVRAGRRMEFSQRLREIGIKTALAISMVLSNAKSPEIAGYEIARLFYAQPSLEFEEFMRRRGAFLGPYDVRSIIEALSKTVG